MSDAKAQIDATVKANDVVLYMKGPKNMPQCGLSSRAAMAVLRDEPPTRLVVVDS